MGPMAIDSKTTLEPCIILRFAFIRFDWHLVERRGLDKRAFEAC